MNNLLNSILNNTEEDNKFGPEDLLVDKTQLISEPADMVQDNAISNTILESSTPDTPIDTPTIQAAPTFSSNQKAVETPKTDKENIWDKYTKYLSQFENEKQEQKRLLEEAKANNSRSNTAAIIADLFGGLGAAAAARYGGKTLIDPNMAGKAIREFGKNEYETALAKAKMADQERQEMFKRFIDLNKPTSESGSSFQQSTILDKNGNAVLGRFNTKTGQMEPILDSEGEPIVRAFAGQFRQDPTTGELIALQPGLQSGNIRQITGVSSDNALQKTKKEKKITADDLTVNQRKIVNEERDRLATLTKAASEQLRASNRLEQILNSDSKLSVAAIKTQMPRLVGEVGNLNQSEQDIWTGSQALLDRANQYLNTLSSSELTSENKKQLFKMINIFKNAAKDTINNITSNSSRQLEQNYKIPASYSNEFLAPAFKMQEQNKLEFVKVQAPDGTIARVKKDQAQKYIDKGAKLIGE